MANTTVKEATQVHGRNPQSLVEQIIRLRIYESGYWKEHCFGLTAASLIDRAVKLKAIGGVYTNNTPTDFICLLLKLLQIQPEKEILVEYLLAEEFKYLRALAAMYVRLTFRPVEVFEILEPLMKDYRKLRVLSAAGYTLTHFDEYIYELLTEERVCDIQLPRIPKRELLEETEGLHARKSLLLEAMQGKESGSENETSDKEENGRERRSRSRSKSRSQSAGYKSRTPSETGSTAEERQNRYVSQSPSRSRSRSKTRSPSPYRSRSGTRSPDRMEED